MVGFVSFGNNRSYEDFKKQIPVSVQPLFDSIREYCIGLGENVVEDVRMHRVLFGKSITFSWFADVELQDELQEDEDAKPSPFFYLHLIFFILLIKD